MENQSIDQRTTARVGLIGCGQIASLWDELSPSAEAKTHAGAFAKDPRFQLAAFFDQDLDRATNASRFWKQGAAMSSFEEFLKMDLDVISICTPESVRLSILQKLPAQKPLVLICEKPLAGNLTEARDILALVQASKWKLAINYIRRYGAGFQALQKRLQQKEWGAIQKVIATYGKGLRNNGTHMLDLMNFLFGKAETVMWLGTVPDDRVQTDPTQDLLMTTASGVPIYMTAVDHNRYTLFEFQIFCEKARVRVFNRGETIQLELVEDDPKYPGYRILGPAQDLESGLKNHFENLASEAYELWTDRKKQSSSTAQAAVELIQLVDAATESRKSEGRKISLK
jgi:predicted dehydrogenase